MDYKFHPAANLFPLLEGEEFEALKESIKEHGQLQAVVLCSKGRILDGRNRYRACKELGIPMRTYRLKDGHKNTLESVYAVETNIKRRNLTASQRALISTEARAMFEAEAAKRRRATQKNDAAKAEVANLPPQSKAVPANLREQSKGEASEQVAEVFNISPRLADQAKRVKRDAIPEVIEEVKLGNLSVHAAEQISQMPKDEQTKVVSMEPKLRKKAIKESRQTSEYPTSLDEAARRLNQDKDGPPKDFGLWVQDFGRALQTMGETDFTPEHVAANYPDWADINVRDFLDDATDFLNKFKTAWEQKHARKSN